MCETDFEAREPINDSAEHQRGKDHSSVNEISDGVEQKVFLQPGSDQCRVSLMDEDKSAKTLCRLPGGKRSGSS